jgi:hypothetical protein
MNSYSPGSDVRVKASASIEEVNQRARQSSPGPLLYLLDQNEPAQMGKDQEITVLSEMNELQEFENEVWSPGNG